MVRDLSGNVHEYSVSELSGAVKKTIEENFGYIRVRGELGRVTRAASGHVYLDMKDDRSVISGVMWKGMAARLAIKPEQGMEVIATGRMSTFPGQSRYQLIIDSLEPAGAGALMALLEERKKKLASEGLFGAERKKPIPTLPEVIGVVTSPSGAVIRDILHRLRDRFPRHVLVWPTLVQGKGADEKIAAAIEGFNQLDGTGGIPRPDVLIVARGGGSLEDLWCFNEERVVRAAAASDIPLISAVGHETDTTLIDYASDIRAPTPTAAAEMAVPVRTELMSAVASQHQRMLSAATRLSDVNRSALLAAARGLGRPEDLIRNAEQRLDRIGGALDAGLKLRASAAQNALTKIAGKLAPYILRSSLRAKSQRAMTAHENLKRAIEARQNLAITRLNANADRLSSRALQRHYSELSGRFENTQARVQLAAKNHQGVFAEKLKNLGRLLDGFSFQSILDRGFVLVRDGEGTLVRRAGDAPKRGDGRLVFIDGERAISFGDGPTSTPKTEKPAKKTTPPKQARLFD